MLDVHGRPDIQACVQQLRDILPALGVARAGDVAVRELVHQNQRIGMLHPESQRRVEIEFRQ
ncbi:hypothetical protein D3C78_1939280 [compost metagenome]